MAKTCLLGTIENTKRLAKKITITFCRFFLMG
uniref:Uncharacterized protein MANES_17G114900 n=1 Tax=Rhizophora mucronata TaxID=61149 RepID=A0A2P2IH26_RHIMU